MESKNLYDYTINDVPAILADNVDAIVIVDPSIDAYKSAQPYRCLLR